ncbi:MAG: hypothetical protein ABJC39_08185, partial [Chloroflexota bacterium]
SLGDEVAAAEREPKTDDEPAPEAEAPTVEAELSAETSAREVDDAEPEFADEEAAAEPVATAESDAGSEIEPEAMAAETETETGAEESGPESGDSHWQEPAPEPNAIPGAYIPAQPEPTDTLEPPERRRSLLDRILGR